MIIDYVVPMLFDSDLKWRDMFRHYHWKRYTPQMNFAPRYRSMGTEELLVRCIRTFMPFINTIHILLWRESQKQAWMDNPEYGIPVVYHREFIPERYLPTFNSRTIEMFLHRIPDLSEHFIYANDDMFPVAPMKEEDFFAEGLPCLSVKQEVIPEEYTQYHWVCKEEAKLIAQDFDRTEPDDMWLSTGHGLTPMLRSVCDKVNAMHKEEIEASVTQRRDWKNFNQYIYVYYMLFGGLIVDRCVPTNYTDTTCPIDEAVEVIKRAEGVVCINDPVRTDNFDMFAASVSAAIEKRLNDITQTNTYGERTESRTAGSERTDDVAVDNKQRRGRSDDTQNKEKVQDKMAQKRSDGKTDTSAAAQAGGGIRQDGKNKKKDNGKRGFRFHS